MNATGAFLLLRFGSLGDVILSFSAGAALKAAHPESQLLFLVKEEYAPLVRAQPWVDEVVPIGAADRGWAGAWRLARALRRRPWRGVLDLQDNLRSRWLAWAAGAPVARWRAERWARQALLRRRGVAGGPAAAPLTPVWRRYLAAAAVFGAAGERPPRVTWGGSAESAAEELWRRWEGSASRVVALAPGAAWPTKAWPESRYLAVGRNLVAAGHRVLVVSTAAERRQLTDLDTWVDGEARAQWLTSSLPVVAACLSRCRAAVTGDTGLSHLAAAVGTPVVALFGSTTPDFGFAPAGSGHRVVFLKLPCQPCSLHGRRRCPLGHLACLHGITPARTLHELEPLLQPPDTVHPPPALAKAQHLC